MMGGGGRDPRGWKAERRRNAIQPSGYWPLVGPGLWSEAEPLGPPGPCRDSPPSSLWGTGTGRKSSRGPATQLLELCNSTDSENLEECSSDGITWNCSFLGKTKHRRFLCQVLGWMGQLCVGVFCFVLFFLLFCLDFVFVF